jgi:hypothetical protein
MLLLMSGIAIGLMMMVNTEGKVGGVDLQNNLAYHNAEGGVEKMTADLAATFKSMQAPKAADICNLSALQPNVPGVTWKDYQVQPSTGCTEALFRPSNGQIQSGPNQGLYAQIIPVTMLATAAQAGGQEVSMTRSAQVALIPVFQFGVFSDSDLSFFSGPNFDFAGRVHTNGDLYPAVGNGSTLTFHDKVTVFGNVIRTQLANNFGTAGNYNGTVQLPTAPQGCDTPAPPAPPLPLPACRALAMSEGSINGAGGNPPQGADNSTVWVPVSTYGAPAGYNSEIVNGNYGLVPKGTGAKSLQLPFVSQGNQPFEIIRRPRAVDPPALSDSREYNMAEIRVLLSDDPLELPAGAVRLANIPASYPNGIPTPVSPAAFPGGIVPALGAGLTYNTYFATSTQGLPDTTACLNTNCGTNVAPTALTPDWPLAPAAHPPGDNVVPPNAPLNNVGVAPAFALCPPVNTNTAPPAGCPATPAIPYFVSNNALPFPIPGTAANWNLLDGWLSVQYKNAVGGWVDATTEWLSLGFARGTVPPTAPGANGIHPNAILILQQPADRDGNGAVDDTGLAPLCTAVSKTTGKCTAWNYGRPPEVVSDFTAVGAPGSTSPFYGVSGAGSISRTNWYPINIYDTREGEPRDVAAGNNSCSAAGVMNAVEIDVGNLKRWLWGQIGANGINVDYLTQNGWVLYISDRRGMLKNPNPPYNGAERSGDSGLEDSVNTASAAGVPDGNLEARTGVMRFSPEDVNKNGVPDFFGAANIGLGFYNGAANVGTAIAAAAPDNPYLRINSCLGTGRKNWVSGARHAVKLVDGGFNNVPYRSAGMGGTLASPGGFTVASENPVYIQGDYNSFALDPAWGGGVDQGGHAAASVIADAVTLLSNNWSDLNSFANPTNLGARGAVTTYYRLAIAGGKNMNFPKPNWGANDYGTDGGTHNFLRYLENWGGQTLWYKGSLVSLYYSTYNTGVFKCCTVVYGAPGRKYSFDADFALPGGLPPGTPLFRDVDTLGYRQLFAVRDH